MELIEREGMTLIRREDGYVNATALCKSAGKLFADYQRLESTKAFLQELSPAMGIPITELIQAKMGGIPSEQGTYVHPLVAINLGQWISPKFAVFVSFVVNGVLTAEPQVKEDFSNLISAKRQSPSIYPISLRNKISTLYGGMAPFIYSRITDKALGEGASAELKRIAGTRSPRWMFLTLEGKGKLQNFVRQLDEKSSHAFTMAEFETVLFGGMLEEATK